MKAYHLQSSWCWLAPDNSSNTQATSEAERLLRQALRNPCSGDSDRRARGRRNSREEACWRGRHPVEPEKMRKGQVDAVVAIAVGPKPRNEQGYLEAKTQADKELAAVLSLMMKPIIWC